MLLESLMDSCFSIKSFLSLSVVKLSKDLRSSGEGLNVGSIRFKHKGTDYKDNFSLGRAKGVPSFLSYFKTLSIGPVPAKLTLPRLTVARVPPQVINKENHGIKSIGYGIKK